ncbi:periplasmic binding protein-like II [Neocallimastix californiae]|uniref:Periplasmic binding protein-like II n=1 Tax=Neocallimastix californiae TaxID=1754190 RepID=A0A1Y2EUE3_9FUNG|nr:periplasmic binding protein-like II [Neocallimastix californiae]|eukprot:ORY75201.1 periplasmic binding protein-like II [Neocallimastix californiae]
MIENLLFRNSVKYDIYFYYGSYTEKYGPYFVNLEKYLSKEHIEKFDKDVIKNVCLYNNVIVGLPVTLDIDCLYSNINLLNTYNETIPKTWDQLINTSKRILEGEKDNNLIAYNGLFNDSEEGNLSIFEMIHSFKDAPREPHPDIKSQKTMDALKMIKRMKDEITQGEEFKKDDGYLLEKLFTGKSIFLKFWYLDYPIPFFKSPIPSAKEEGVSGTLVGGYNIAISKYSKNIESAIKVLEFITSEEIQKRSMHEDHIFSAIDNLYDDPVVCSYTDCEFVKSIQPFSFVQFNTGVYDIDYYNERYRQYFYEYIYGNEALSHVLKKIDDLTKYYKFSISREDTSSGFIVFIIYLVIAFIMCATVAFLFIKKYNNYFKFLSKDFWIIFLLGNFILMSSMLTLYGNVTKFKCGLRISLLSFGFTLSIIPIIHKLIINLTDDNNKITKWIKNNKYLFLIGILLIDLIILSLLGIKSYSVYNIIIEEGENSQKCKMIGNFGNNIIYSILIFNGIIILSILILVFLEWNIKETYYDIRFLSSGLFINFLSMIIYYAVNKLEMNSYVDYNLILSSNILIVSFSNYLFIYGYRIVVFLFKNDKNEYNIQVRMSTQNRLTSTTKSSLSNDSSSKKSKVSNKLLYYHYRESRMPN